MTFLHRAMAAVGRVRRSAPAVRRTFTFEADIDAPPERAFPLACPIRENEWIEGWSAQVVCSSSGFAEPGAIFRTKIALGELWVTSLHEPKAFRVEYVIFAGGHAVLKFEVAFQRIAGDRSKMRIVRAYTGIDALGRHRVLALSEDGVRRENELIARQLDHFLRTGEVLRRDGSRRANA